MTDRALAAILAGLFGLLIGSFLNVCIVRLPADQSVVRPRSRCPRCGRPIAWYDNIPVLSWVLLRGKCRHCGAPISIQYPLVELAVGGLWAGAVLGYGVSLEALRAALFGTLLLGIAVTDARTQLIPDEFTWSGLILGLGFAALDGAATFVASLLGAGVGFGSIWATGKIGRKLFRREAMGGGDMMMMAMVGVFVGWKGVLLTIFLGSLAGSLVFGPIALVRRQKHLELPFGVFLAMGAAVTWLAGPALLAWYRRFLGGGG